MAGTPIGVIRLLECGEYLPQMGGFVWNVLHDMRGEPQVFQTCLLIGSQHVERLFHFLKAVVNTGEDVTVPVGGIGKMDEAIFSYATTGLVTTYTKEF